MGDNWFEKIVAGGATLLIAWGTWMTKRSFAALSRHEHNEICERRNMEIKEALQRIESTVQEDRQETKRHREVMTDKIGKISSQVAVLYDRTEREG